MAMSYTMTSEQTAVFDQGTSEEISKLKEEIYAEIQAYESGTDWCEVYSCDGIVLYVIDER